MKPIILILVFVIISCNTQKRIDNSIEEKMLYKVYKIDSINDYYLVFAKKQDSIFKIVSKKNFSKNCNSVKVGKKYSFKLKSNRTLAPTINGVKIAAQNVDCYVFDKETSICVDRKNGIYNLYFADNLKGLCLIN